MRSQSSPNPVDPGSRLDRWWLPASCGIALHSTASNDHATFWQKKYPLAPMMQSVLSDPSANSTVTFRSTGWISVRSFNQPKESKRLQSEKITKYENYSCNCITLDDPSTNWYKPFWVDSFFAFDISHCVCCVTWHFRLKQHGEAILGHLASLRWHMHIIILLYQLFCCSVLKRSVMPKYQLVFSACSQQYTARHAALLGARANIFHLIALTVHGGKIWQVTSQLRWATSNCFL